MPTSKERLFIKKIEIQNAGRFYGSNHSITFSDSPDKNITIIIGHSGKGKSTIHDLIYWCLYGKHKEHSVDERKDIDYGLINSDALERLSEGNSVTASVTITLHNANEQKYILTRKLKATYGRNSTKREFEPLNNSKVQSGIIFETTVKLQMKDESGEPINEKNSIMVGNEINKYFPRHLSDFFLFDGENLTKFRNKSSSDFIKNGITKISGLEILNSLASSADQTAGNISKHIGGKSASAAPFNAKRSKLSESADEVKQKLVELRQELHKAEIHHENISEMIKKNKDGDKLIANQENAQKNKINATRDLKQINDNIKDTLFDKIPQLLIRETLQKSEQIFGRLEDEDKIPPSISRGSIDKILSSDPLTCVCGRKFDKNENENEPWMTLNKIKDVIIEDDLSQGISLGRDLISRIIDMTSIEKTRHDYYNLLEQRRNKRREIQKFDAEINDLHLQIKDIDYDSTEDLGSRKKQYWEQCVEYASSIKSKDSELEDLNQELKNNQKHLDDAVAKEGKYEREIKKISLAKSVSKFAKVLEKRIEEILRKNTQQATSKYFLESAPEKDTFDHVSISENYNIVAKDSSGLVSILSKGQAHVLGLSYVAGIREITRTNTFLIIDSPLHNISGIARNEISEVFSKYLPDVQIILLVTDTEYLHGDPDGAKSVKSILHEKGRIWKEYIIESKKDDGIDSREIMEYTK